MDDQSQNPLLSQIDSDEQKRQALQQAILAKIQTAQADTTDVDAARDKAGRDQMISGIGRAVEGFSRANAQSRGGSAVDPTLYNNIDARAHQDVKDAIAARQQKVAFALEQAKQQNEAIKEGRDVTKLKIDATNKINEDSHRKAQDDIATQQLGVNQDNSTETNRHNQASEANGLQIHKDNLAAKQQHDDDAAATKLDTQTNKMAMMMKDDLDPNKARGGNLAKNQAQVDQADRLNQLYTEANGDIRNLDKRQMEEMAIGTNRLLSQSGQGASEQIKALVPASAVGDYQKLMEWWVNDPQGLNQRAFVQRMGETVKRERDLGVSKVKQTQIQRLSAHSALKQSNPELYGQILRSYGIDPDTDIDEKGQYKNAVQFRDNSQNDQASKPSWAK